MLHLELGGIFLRRSKFCSFHCSACNCSRWAWGSSDQSGSARSMDSKKFRCLGSNARGNSVSMRRRVASSEGVQKTAILPLDFEPFSYRETRNGHTRRHSACTLDNTAVTMLCASTWKKGRKAARVSLRPKPSVPRVA